MNEFICKKLDSLTAWIGAIGLVLLIIHWTSALFILFVALIIMPESKFSDFFKKAAKEVKEKTHHDHPTPWDNH